jgi:mgtE-like transporter
MLKEGAPVVLFCAILGSIGGLMLGGIKKFIEQKPAILILYPALIGNLGAMGSIIGSTTTSRLHLGRITPQVSSLKNAVSEITAIEVSSIFIHMTFGLIAFIFTSKIFLKTQLNVVILPSISILSNLISFIPICLLSFMIAILTFRKGLDPDNFVIPLETSISDVLATFSLYTAIIVIYHIIG